MMRHPRMMVDRVRQDDTTLHLPFSSLALAIAPRHLSFVTHQHEPPTSDALISLAS